MTSKRATRSCVGQKSNTRKPAMESNSTAGPNQHQQKKKKHVGTAPSTTSANPPTKRPNPTTVSDTTLTTTTTTTTTASTTAIDRDPLQPAPKRKPSNFKDEISCLVQKYLSDTDPSLWSLEHLKTVIGNKFPSRQKWCLQIELDELCRTSVSPDCPKVVAARKLLQKINPRKGLSAPVATFGVTPTAASSSTANYAQNSTADVSVASGIPVSGDASSSDNPNGLPVTPPRRNPTMEVSPSSSELSRIDYGPYSIENFLGIYPALQTKFSLKTAKRDTSLEDVLYVYLLDAESSTAKDNTLLQAGFIDIIARLPKLLTTAEQLLVMDALRMEESHVVATCVKNCFEGCKTYECFVKAKKAFSCDLCEFNPLFQQATSAVLFAVHFLLNTSFLSTTLLEGNFDVIWGNIIDYAFIFPEGFLHRKEKTSDHSSYKFDGLFIGGRVEPQDWLVIEVARTSGQGTKQTIDRKKLIEHCLRILNYRRWYLSTRTNLRGENLVAWLRKFPMWGILCQGFEIEIIRLGWLTRGVGIVTTFAGGFPTHMIHLESLYRVLEEVHYASESVRTCVREWDTLHRQMTGNKLSASSTK